MKAHDLYIEATISGNPLLASSLERLRGSRMMVTGASGIVGFAVARILSGLGVELVLHARTPYSKVEAEFGPGATWLYGLLTDALARAGRFDFSFHCATYGQPQKFSSEWRDTINLNVDSLFRMLDTSERVAFASTTEIYSGISISATEDMVGDTTPQHPRSAYIEAKRVGEAICFHSGRGVSNRIALAAGPYPKTDDSRALYQIIRRAVEKKAVQLMGGNSNIRQYQYSLACALRFIITSVSGTQPVYNNAGPYVVSMEELGRLVASRLGVEFIETEERSGLSGAPVVVSVSNTRSSAEFPFLADIDPPIEAFIDAVIEATNND